MTGWTGWKKLDRITGWTAGWEVRSRANASPALAANVDRFTQYLTVVGLTALLIGGVGVANAVKTQIWTALIAMLLLRYARTLHGDFCLALTLRILSVRSSLPRPLALHTRIRSVRLVR